ncbi:DUF6979 family protein [Aquirufa lenticrescens]
MANQFYQIAIQTLGKLESQENLNSKIILDAWKQSLVENNKNYLKGCPKNAFTSIILNNHVKFENQKNIDLDTDSKEYEYCREALNILRNNPHTSLKPLELWKRVLNNLNLTRSHQGEMDVVMALWKNNKIK